MPQSRGCLVGLCRAARRIARLFSGNLCASRIASKPLHERKRHLIKGLIKLSTKMELSQSGLQ